MAISKMRFSLTGAKPHKYQYWHGWGKCSGELEAPGQYSDAIKYQVRAKSPINMVD